MLEASSEFGCTVLIGHHTNRIEGASGFFRAAGASVAEWGDGGSSPSCQRVGVGFQRLRRDHSTCACPLPRDLLQRVNYILVR